jgi:CHAD domain-containing protein
MARKPVFIRPNRQFEESLREALLTEIDVALAECDRLSGWEQSERREAVHELRRALKRFRAGASLCKGAVDAVEVRAVQDEVRATAERLSATRDRDVLVDTIGEVVKFFPPPSRRSVQAITVAVLAPEKATTSAEDWAAAGALIRGQLEGMRSRMMSVSLRAVAPDGASSEVARRWRRCRRTIESPLAQHGPERLHEIRKDCQRLSMQLFLLSRLGPRRRLTTMSARLAKVVSKLGCARDLSVLGGLLVQRRSEFPDPAQVDAMIEEVDRRATKCLKRAGRLARSVLATKPAKVRGLLASG